MDTSDHKSVDCGDRHSWQRIRSEPPRYQKIAWDIASKIVEGEYREGDKLHSRSNLTSQYNVSSETARRAICILDDLGIVKAVQGSGVVVVSSEKAAQYLRQYREFVSLGDMRSSVLSKITELHENANDLCAQLGRIVEQVEHFKESNPFVPYHIEVPPDSPQISKTLQELNFWHNTQATVVAIERNGELHLSPGPYFSLQELDIVFYIGNDECVNRVAVLLNT